MCRILGQQKHQIFHSFQSDQAYAIQDYQSEVCSLFLLYLHNIKVIKYTLKLFMHFALHHP